MLQAPKNRRSHPVIDPVIGPWCPSHFQGLLPHEPWNTTKAGRTGELQLWLVVKKPLGRIIFHFHVLQRSLCSVLHCGLDATLYRGRVSRSNLAGPHLPQQNHSQPGPRTQREAAELATLGRCAEQNLLPPVQWPGLGPRGIFCP